MSYDGMVDLAKTPMEQEENSKPIVCDNVYPYGCALSLDDEVLKKLGLDCEDPECQVGNYLEVRLLCEVTGLNSHDTGEGKKHCLNLQATHMEIVGDGEPDGDEEKSHEDKPYRAANPY